MAKASNNEFPSVLFTDGTADPSSPSASTVRLYFKNDTPYWINSGGTAVAVNAADLSASNLSDLSDVGTATPTDGQVLTYATATSTWEPAAAAGGGSSWNDVILDPPSGTYDDEFDDASINAAWATELDITGTTTWTESNDLMSCKFASQAASDVAALLKSMTLNVGDYVETAVRLFGKDENYSMVGICMSDGTASTSNAVAALFYAGGTSPVIDAGRNGTFTNLGTGGSTITMQQAFAFPWLHIRLTYQAANTFRVEVSPDGVSWTNQGVADVTPTITPTHAGLVVSRWGGGAEESIASFQYFRSNA